MISEKANRIGASPTFKIAAKARAMRAEGIDVADFSIGEPDFPTPDNVKAAGIRAIQENFTKYTESDGTPALRKAVAARLKEDFGLDYPPGQIIVSTGAKSSLFHAIQALVDKDDEVIIPSPYWVTYPELVRLAEGRPVFVPTKEENGFVLTPEDLRAHITPATKALLLNSPSNPTGATYTRPQLEALAEVVRGEDIFVISDEIYASLVFDGLKATSFAALGEDIKKKTVVINGVSKTYAMTGWRIGYAAGPAEIIAAMSRIQSHTTSNAVSISQKATQEALSGSQADVSRMVAEFQRRRNYALAKLAAIPGLSCFKSQGAFYLFPNVRSFYDKEFNGTPIRNSYGMAYFLLREAQVAIVPGDSFGADDFIRLSYATSMDNLEKGLDRMARALARLQPARKTERIALSNAVTRVRRAVPVDAALSPQVRDGLVAEAAEALAKAPSRVWNANVNGVIVQLRTNVRHLHEFWADNWAPAPLEADLEPHGVVYAVDGLPGREPRSFYDSATKTGVLVNVDAYGPLRSLALGLVTDVSERLFGVHALRGMAVEAGGAGLILVGPPGTNKTELFLGLLRDPKVRFHASEIVFLRAAGERVWADNPERKAFLPTSAVEILPRLAPLFDAALCENVVLRKEDCRDAACLRGEDCRLDRGSAFCYKAAPDAYGLLDPAWLAGPEGAVRRAELRRIFLLRKDAVSPPVEEIGRDAALRILVAGEVPGMKTGLTAPAKPFFNPHLLVTGEERQELRKAFFARILGGLNTYVLNAGAAGPEKIREIAGI